jgi:hypothetical protein
LVSLIYLNHVVRHELIQKCIDKHVRHILIIKFTFVCFLFSEKQRQNQENIAKLIEEQKNAQKEALDKQKQDLQDHFNKLQKDRDEQLEKEQAKYEALVNDRLEKEAAQKEIERYKKEQNQRRKKWLPARLWGALWND